MGWFDEQIKLRKQSDDDMFADSFLDMAGAVLGRKMFMIMSNKSEQSKKAVEDIMHYFHIKMQDVPEVITDINEKLEYLMRPHGIMRRNVNLKGKWYKDAIGPFLAIRKDNQEIVALIPDRYRGYKFLDTSTGRYVKVNSKNASHFDEEAIAFYKPFPLRELKVKDLIKYIAESLSGSDIVIWMFITLFATGVGLLIPRLNNYVIQDVVKAEDITMFGALTVTLVTVMVGKVLLEIVKILSSTRINIRMEAAVESATMMRVLSLPTSFFKKYSAGELAERSQYINSLCEIIVETLLTGFGTSIFSLLYITQIKNFAPSLMGPALIIILLTFIFTIISTIIAMNNDKIRMERSSKESGLSFGLLNGLQKIKLSGSEKRAFAKWAGKYSKVAEKLYNPPFIVKVSSAITAGISLIGTVVIYFVAVKTGVSVSEFYAFNTAYALVMAAFTVFAESTITMSEIKPIMDMAKPILENVPEISEGKQVITSLSGGVEINNVTFRYSDNTPIILDNFSLKIRPGQYLAIVGKTGCGKSTLMKLLLGFETPQRGAIYYDGIDMNSIDLRSLRRKIGVVTQDGGLFNGDLYSNITISAPWLSLDEAWEAAEVAGIADDIRRMPMGMFTLVSDGSSGISGGQKQRIMIARAIAPKAKVLMFDEATSALDNISQKKVSDALDKLKCTRIVIAHRLSTIKNCDRIVVLDNGKIVEDGSYDELIAKKGFFAELVERQRIDMD